LIQNQHSLPHKLYYHHLWQLFERHAVHVCPYSLLDASNQPFYFADIVIVRVKIHVCWLDVILDSLKIHVGVNVDDVETTPLINIQDRLGLLQHHCFGSALNWGHRSKLNLPRNIVKKREPLNKKKSVAKVTSLWSSTIGFGISTGLKVGTCDPDFFTVFPCMLALSVP
jgi:hypothetical protein